MFGSLIIFASGDFAKFPSSVKASFTFWLSLRKSEKCAKILPDKEMSRVSTLTLAAAENAFTIGKNEYVAKAGASSVFVYIILDFCIGEFCLSFMCLQI